jgi:hypothetical protein
MDAEPSSLPAEKAAAEIVPSFGMFSASAGPLNVNTRTRFAMTRKSRAAVSMAGAHSSGLNGWPDPGLPDAGMV